MRLPPLALIALAAGAALFLARDFLFNGRNIDERKEYWEGEISRTLTPGASKEALLAFAKAHGQTLDCYQNYRKEDQCGFDDEQSIGGTSSRPMKLALIFSLEANKLTSHEITLTPANAPH